MESIEARENKVDGVEETGYGPWMLVQKKKEGKRFDPKNPKDKQQGSGKESKRHRLETAGNNSTFRYQTTASTLSK